MSLRAWPAGIMPSALVNEKFVSAFELRIATPRPSSSAGGRISGKNAEEFGPLARAPGAGHAPGEEDKAARPRGVLRLEESHDAPHARVAARAAPPALDPEAVTLADDMDVRQMRDAPDAIAQWRG